MSRNKAFDLALKAFLFLSPLFFFRDYEISYARGLFFVLGTFALFGISLEHEPRRRFANIWVSMFLLLAFTRMFFDNSFGIPGQEWFNFWMACAGFIYPFCGVLLFYTVYCHADRAETYLKPIAFVCVLNLLLTVAQILKHDFMWTYAPSICGFMETSSQLGQYSALALPIAYYLNPYLAIIPLISLLLAKSVSPILASVAGIAFLAGFKAIKLKVMATGMVILVLLGIFNFGYIKAKFQCRPVMWRKTLKVALQKPYLGWGYGSYRSKITEAKDIASIGGGEYLRAHNDYLHTAQELGFPIVACIVMFFAGLFKKFRAIKNKDKLTLCLIASVIIVLINMSGQTLIRYASITGTFTVLLALLCIKIGGIEDADTDT